MPTESPEQPGGRLAEATISELVARRVITMASLRKAMEVVDSSGARAEGPRLMARAWVDPAFRSRLLGDARVAAQELGIEAVSSTNKDMQMVVVESTAEVHNLIVCTLCSCYPVGMLGLPPPWYKSREYRARAAAQPRALLRDSFGLEVPDEVEVRVHDSTQQVRYIVLPCRPPGTRDWSEKQLQRLITRDTMIGVAVPQAEGT